MRAHTSVAVDDLMYVFGGADSHGCLWSLYILEMGIYILLALILYLPAVPF